MEQIDHKKVTKSGPYYVQIHEMDIQDQGIEVLRYSSFPKYNHREFWYTIIGYIQVLFSSGIVFGWSALLPVLIDDGVFSDECDQGEILCDGQLARLNDMFICGSTGLYLSNSLFGPLLDYAGPRWTSCIAAVMLALGSILCVFEVYLFGFFLLGMAGPGVQLAPLHIFERYPFKIGSLIQGAVACFDAGAFIFLGFYILHFYSYYHINQLFVLYLIVPLFIFCTSLLFWRNSPQKQATLTTGPLSSLSLKNQLLSKQNIFLFGYIFIHTLRLNFIIATVLPQLLRVYDDDSAKNMNLVFNIILPFGFIFAPLAGKFIDKNGPSYMFVVSNIAGIIYGICMFFLHIPFFFYLMCICMASSRQLVFGSNFTALTKWFGNKTFGRVLGVQKFFVTLVGYFQYILIDMTLNSFGGDYTVANVILLLSVIPLLLFQRNEAMKI